MSNVAAIRRDRVVVAAALLALVLEVMGHLLDFGLDDLRVHVLDSSREWSWSHIVATGAFACGATVSAFATRAQPRGRAREWGVLSLLFGVLLIDNVTRAHTTIPEWPLVVAPALVGVAILVARLARGTAQWRTAIVAISLLAASFAIHVLGHALVHGAGWGPAAWGYQIKVALKEGTELAGWVLLMPVLVRLASPRRAAPRA